MKGKKSRGENDVAESDHAPSRLCALPDELLQDIMVLLPINEAVRTCILAKRWEHLWRSMPCLIFKEDSTITNFNQFAERVCNVRDHPTAKELMIQYCQDRHDQLNALIMVAIKDQVQELFMDISEEWPPSSYKPPNGIFRLETLVRFELHADKLYLPDSISLPRLKVLHLQFVKTKDGKSIQKLISSCPILEELTLNYCWWGDHTISRVTYSAPNLQRLCVRSSDYPPTLPDLSIHCENLKELRYVGTLEHEILVSGGNPKNLEHAMLNFLRPTDSEWGVKLLNRLSSTRRLTLSSHSAEILDNSTEKILGLPQFDNMVELCIYGLQSLNVTAQVLLINSPSLQMLTVQGCWHRTPLRMYDLLDSTHLCHMKKITLAPHHGHIDLSFVGVLLRNCTFLEELVLRIRRSGVDDAVLGMVRRLDKVSEDCRIYTEYF